MKKLLAIILALFTAAGAFSGCGRNHNAGQGPEKEADMGLIYEVCSADEGLQKAKACGAVVLEDLICTANRDGMERFYADSQAGRAAKVLVASYMTLDKERMSEELYEEEKDRYPMLILTLVEHFAEGHEGKPYRVVSRVSSEREIDSEDEYEYLMHYTGDMPVPNAKYSGWERYVLVDDDALTWERIEFGMLSSQFGDMVRSRTVFAEFAPKPNEDAFTELVYSDLFNRVCTADEGLELAREAGAVILENARCTANKERMEEFYERARAGQSLSLLLAHYYTIDPEGMTPEAYEREKDDYPKLFFMLLESIHGEEGEGYRLRVRQSGEAEPETDEYAPYLMHYLSDLGNTPSSFALCDQYVLVNDDTVTWEQIEHGMLSADFRDQIPHYSVFTDFMIGEDEGIGFEMPDKVCSAEEGLALAKQLGAVVVENFCCTANKYRMERFYETTRKGEPAKLLTAQYNSFVTEDGQPDRTILTFTLVEYLGAEHEGPKFRATVRSCGEAEAKTQEFEYLMHYVGSAHQPFYSSLYVPPSERYVLVNDDSVTWEQVEGQAVLSAETGGGIPHCIVFEEHTLVFQTQDGN